LTLQTNSGNLIISGKNFDGWNTAADGSGTSYAAGGTYSANTGVTLFAKWLNVDTYTISYDGNGNTGGTAPGNQTKTQNVTQNIPLTLAANSGNLVKAGYSFAGWNTASDGSGTSYAAGGSFTTDATTTLYAIWVATVTETFDTEASATEHGWRGSNNTTGGNDFKWSNTSTVSGSAGEAGGSFARSGSFRSYANTTIGSYSRTNVLKMSGSFKLNNADFDGSFYIGYFKSGSEATNFAGIAISEPSGGASNPFRGYAAVNITGQTRSSMIELTQNTTYSFDLSWLGNADGSGTLSGTVAGTPVNVAVAAGSGTFDAFGLMCGGFTDVSAQNTINCYFDDLTYNMNSQIAEWNGTAWSNGGPNGYKSAVVDGNISTTGFTAINLTVNPGKQLSISSGTLTVNGNLTLKSSDAGTATFINGGTLAVTGTTSVEQYLAHTRNWYISSPVTGAVAPSGYTYYQRDEAYNSGEGSWTSQPFTAGNTFAVGKGYIALPGTAASVMSFSGTINSGNQTIALTKGGTGFNLIGNPYPAHLTWTQAFAEASTAPEGGTAPATLIEPSVWIRTNAGTVNNSNQWSFQTYNASTGLAVPGKSLLSGGVIPPMQAFWVKAKEAGNLILTNDLTMSHQSDNPLRAHAVNNSDRQLIRLEVSNGVKTDETLLFFDVNAADGKDAFDSPKFAEASTEMQLFTTVNTERLVMNGMRDMPLNQPITLGFVPGSASSFSIKVNEALNLPSDVHVYLKDNAKDGLETDLTDGVTNYQFNATSNDTNRFSVLFKSPGTSTDIRDNLKIAISVYVNSENQLMVNATAGSSYAIFNTTGQLIEQGLLNKERETRSIKLSAGVYVVKVNNLTSRVIVK
jgi:hypothetical protein